MTKKNRICLGAVAGVHGIKGEVKVKSFTEVDSDLDRYGLVENEAGDRRFELKVVGHSKELLRVKIKGVDDRNEAEKLIGTAFFVDRSVLPELSECTFRIACDVTNPLCGSNGCSAVFGPQKGADAVMIKRMDTSLASYAALCRKTFPNVDAEFPGTGAAGGLGFAFQTFLSASLEPGIQIVLDETRLRDDVRDADLVITGEGQLDGQTVMGKAPIGVAKLSKEYGKPVLAFSGCVTKDASTCNAAGIDAFFPIMRSVVSLEEAMDIENAAENMTDTVEQAFRLFLLQ